MSQFVLGVPTINKPQAKAKAKAKAKQMKRDTTTASCTVLGDPSIKAGAEMTFVDIRPGLDGVPFIIKSVTHSFQKNGYTTSIDAELKV